MCGQEDSGQHHEIWYMTDGIDWSAAFGVRTHFAKVTASGRMWVIGSIKIAVIHRQAFGITRLRLMNMGNNTQTGGDTNASSQSGGTCSQKQACTDGDKPGGPGDAFTCRRKTFDGDGGRYDGHCMQVHDAHDQ